MKKLLILFIGLLLTSCSFAPLNSTKSASSIGKGKWLIETGISPALFAAAERGITENFDLGLSYESQFSSLLTLTSKYAFINNPQGFSFSWLGALFTGANSDGFYIGPIVGYRIKWFETYFSARYNHVEYDEIDLSNDEDDSLFSDLVISGGKLSYMQYNLGVNFWTSEKFGVNVNLLALGATGSSSEIDESTTYGFSFIWKI